MSLSNYHEASLNQLWFEAMYKEIDAFNTNHRDLVDLSKGKKAIGSK